MERQNMVSLSVPRVSLIFCFLLLSFHTVHCSVTYDKKAIIINGQRRILISGSIHYPRSTPEMWRGLIDKAKFGGLDVIDTYVFWNGHEPSRGTYNFEGRYDLVRFIKTVHDAGLYVNLRIGPYICAEWNFGGFPVWLKYIPGIRFRTDNEPFKYEMQRFVEKIVKLIKRERLFESQGGPIILSQIENEYGPLVELTGHSGYEYMNWAANMAVGTNTGVPWVMCKEPDAPGNIINTCNGYYCHKFMPNKPYKPIMWTEAWSGWYTEFGGTIIQRPVQDLAFAVARFVQMGGSFINHYMYHGGTNFGHTAGGPFVATSYDYNAPIDEYGLTRQPNYGHLKELHRSIKMCEKALVSSDPIFIPLGNSQQAYVYSADGACAAFLSNYDTKSAARVRFNNMNYNLPPWSVSILPDCRNVVFNTAKIGVQTSQVEMRPTDARIFSWGVYNEDISSSDDSLATFTTVGLLEQINVTRDSSDYLWYKTSVYIDPSEQFLQRGELPTLRVFSSGHALHVYINGQLSGSASGQVESAKFVFTGKVNLRAGTNSIALLSVAVGLPNIGTHFETRNAGILGPVKLYGLVGGKRDLSWQKWTYQVGLQGEALNLYTASSISSAEWMQASLIWQRPQPLTWHKATFDEPDGTEPLALDMRSMWKGEAWINGQSIGRYWLATSMGNCTVCNFAGQFKLDKCQTGCGEPTQQWYHVPRSWLKPTQNQLVVLEELMGDPTKISLVKRTLTSVCANVEEYHPTIRNWHIESDEVSVEKRRPKIHLRCGLYQYISSIKFASFGTPSGTCGHFQQGRCHAEDSRATIEKMCLGKGSCSVPMSADGFRDPCPSVLKRLAVEAVCLTTQRKVDN